MTGARSLWRTPALALPLALLLASLAGCATARVDRSYEKWAAADPRSILIVPVVNNTVDVDAAAYFLSTIPIPVAERGYYVFPVNMVDRKSTRLNSSH